MKYFCSRAADVNAARNKNNPQFKLEDIRILPEWYSTIFKPQAHALKWESVFVFWLLQKKGNIFLFINSYQRTLRKKTSPVEKSKLFVNNFSVALQNIWRIWNTIASTLRKNILVHLPTDVICSSKLTSSVSSIYFVPWIFPWMFFKE